MADRRTAGLVVALALVVGLAGDACHVAAGTTRYEWDGVPTVWRSAIWFPVALAAAVLAAAWLSERAGTPAVRTRTRADAVAGAAVVLALYALTALLNDTPATVSVVLVGAIAVASGPGGTRRPARWPWPPRRRCWARSRRSPWSPSAPPL